MTMNDPSILIVEDDTLIAMDLQTTLEDLGYQVTSVVSTGEKQLHDCGIIYSPTNTYVLCIMTKGTNFTDLANTIKNISSMVYSYINAK